MTERRPTVPIDEWRIALNLSDTRLVQKDRSAPAYNCECNLCQRWKEQYRELLPESLYKELSRAQINLDYPTELYEYGRQSENSLVRIHFHIVGKVLSGPQTSQPKETGRHLHYSEVRESPLVSISVIRHSESLYEYHPEYNKTKSGEIILLDIRLAFLS